MPVQAKGDCQSLYSNSLNQRFASDPCLRRQDYYGSFTDKDRIETNFREKSFRLFVLLLKKHLVNQNVFRKVIIRVFEPGKNRQTDSYRLRKSYLSTNSSRRHDYLKDLTE